MSRGKGLVWIIHKLNKLGVPLTYGMLPSFLSVIQPSFPQAFLEELEKKANELKRILYQYKEEKGKHKISVRDPNKTSYQETPCSKSPGSPYRWLLSRDKSSKYNTDL